MPRLRLLADVADSHGTAPAGADRAGNWVFDVGAGEVVPLVFDAVGYVGNGDTIASSDWDGDDSLTISARTLAGNVASCLVAVPEGGQVWPGTHRVRNTLTLSSGRVRRTAVWLRAQSR